jgi:hypothetical protein
MAEELVRTMSIREEVLLDSDKLLAQLDGIGNGGDLLTWTTTSDDNDDEETVVHRGDLSKFLEQNLCALEKIKIKT